MEFNTNALFSSREYVIFNEQEIKMRTVNKTNSNELTNLHTMNSP